MTGLNRTPLAALRPLAVPRVLSARARLASGVRFSPVLIGGKE